LKCCEEFLKTSQRASACLPVRNPKTLFRGSAGKFRLFLVRTFGGISVFEWICKSWDCF
jgi:hypothetical protein